MVSGSQRRDASEEVQPATSWNAGSGPVDPPVTANNSTENQSAHLLAPPLRVPVMKTSTQSSYAESVGLTDTVVLREVIHVIDDFGLPEFLQIAAAYGQDRFGYVVTPNVDHLIRYYEDPSFRAHYRSAQYILMDSRFAARLVYLMKGVRLPVCTGSDLTAQLLAEVIQSNDRIVMIGGSAEQAHELRRRYGLSDLRHHNPPMGFINDPAAVEACLDFIEKAGPFRFCFLAVGSPQQETLAQALKARGIARGLALCVGASLNFITGQERRAPVWMQKIALEWLYRLLQNPKRLARRYLVRGPRIFAHLRRSRVVLRKPAASI
jgi:exopolysaccharide biosynthesis WecB/TagA/CpsF family protein